jgi:hypothetical protein
MIHEIDAGPAHAPPQQDDCHMHEARDILAGVVAHTLETLLGEAQSRQPLAPNHMSSTVTLAQCLIDTSKERDSCRALVVELQNVVEEISQLRQLIAADVKSIFDDITTTVRGPRSTSDKLKKLRAMIKNINL